MARLVLQTSVIVWVGVASQYVPYPSAPTEVPGPSAKAQDLQKQMNGAIAAKASSFVVPPGFYDFGNTTFWISEARDMVIKTDRAVISFYLYFGGVALERCENVTFQGFTIDRNPPPWIQATAMSEGSQNGMVNFQIPEGYATPMYPGWLSRWFTTASDGYDKNEQFTFNPLDQPDEDGLPWIAKHRCSIDLDKIHWTGNRTFESAWQCALGATQVITLWQGSNLVLANSSTCTVEDVIVHASGYMVAGEMDGHGGHTYRNVSAVPGKGRLIVSTADGLHSTDVDVGPLIENVHFSRLLDDFMNIQTTIHFVWNQSNANDNDRLVKTAADEAAAGPTITVVTPHTNDMTVDDIVPDTIYGTTQPIRRMRAGDMLRFFDPISFAHLGDVPVASQPIQLDAPINSSLGKQADSLFNVIANKPYDMPHLQPEKYRLQHWRSSVYRITLAGKLPLLFGASATLQVPYVVESGRSQNRGAHVLSSRWDHTSCLLGRFKSSNALIINNTFSHATKLHLELQMIPSFYEGPILIDNVTIANNTFYVPKGSSTDFGKDYVWTNTAAKTASNIVLEGNVVHAVEGCAQAYV